MRYDDPELQDLLAAEWVLGSLRGAARRRMRGLMATRPRLRERVADWEERWFALELQAPQIRPPARVWSGIHARVVPPRTARWNWLNWGWGWTLASVLALWLTLALLAPPAAPPALTIARLDDAQGQPALLVSWRDDERSAQRVLQVRVLAHPEMPAGTTWQAWLVGAPGTPPVALGEIGVEREQRLVLPAPVAALLSSARQVGVSVEPKGATGGPRMPFLFVGPTLRVDG